MSLSSQNRLTRFLTELDKNNVRYVSWKNNHQLQAVFAGQGDIDLFVPIEDRPVFIRCCEEQSWIEVTNPMANYPHVSHFYGLGNSTEKYHIHVYFKLITGDSWLKEYCIPIDSWLIENRIWNPDYGIWTLSNVSQSYLFLFRHLMKNGSIAGRLLYSNEIASYREEWNLCSADIKPNDIRGPIDLEKHIVGARVFSGEVQLAKIVSAISFRFSLRSYLRFTAISLPFRRMLALLNRLSNKIFFKKKKLLLGGGIAVAISGVDGAGKSTMLNEAIEVFGEFLTIRTFHLGRPQGKVVELLWRTLGNRSENSSMPGTSQNDTTSTVGRAINGAILALLRLSKARSVIRISRKGGLMLIDRWPTDELGKMDGPRVRIGPESGKIQQICSAIESWAYENMPKVDVCFFFQVPVEVAKERNRQRVKENKETDEMISARFLGNFEYKPLAKKTIRFDNSGDFLTKRNEFIEQLWQEIASRN